ncbi:MAG: hypothetical protein ACYSTF_00595 [Planctomycetota bacterium]|jgi:Fe-S-cluster containining protein
MDIIDFTLDIFGDSLYVQIGARNRRATLSDIVPMARELTTIIGQVAREKAVSSGFTVPCRKGCAVCCHNLVCLSVPEALRLVEEVGKLPLGRRMRMVRSCRLIAETILARLDPAYNYGKSTPVRVARYCSQLSNVLSWYFRRGLSCPFLDNDVCTIYRNRPIICREHMVIGFGSPCRADGMDQTFKMDLPISIPSILTELSSKVQDMCQEPVVLPCVFDWYENYKGRHKRTWPAAFLVEGFVEIALRFQRQRRKESNQVTSEHYNRERSENRWRVPELNQTLQFADGFQQSLSSSGQHVI